jgi:hypothetical protein
VSVAHQQPGIRQGLCECVAHQQPGIRQGLTLHI